MRIPPRIYTRCSLCPCALRHRLSFLSFSLSISLLLFPSLFFFFIVSFLFLHGTIPLTSGPRDILSALRRHQRFCIRSGPSRRRNFEKKYEIYRSRWKPRCTLAVRVFIGSPLRSAMYAHRRSNVHTWIPATFIYLLYDKYIIIVIQSMIYIAKFLLLFYYCLIYDYYVTLFSANTIKWQIKMFKFQEVETYRYIDT